MGLREEGEGVVCQPEGPISAGVWSGLWAGRARADQWGERAGPEGSSVGTQKKGGRRALMAFPERKRGKVPGRDKVGGGLGRGAGPGLRGLSGFPEPPPAGRGLQVSGRRRPPAPGPGSRRWLPPPRGLRSRGPWGPGCAGGRLREPGGGVGRQRGRDRGGGREGETEGQRVREGERACGEMERWRERAQERTGGDGRRGRGAGEGTEAQTGTVGAGQRWVPL